MAKTMVIQSESCSFYENVIHFQFWPKVFWKNGEFWCGFKDFLEDYLPMLRPADAPCT